MLKNPDDVTLIFNEEGKDFTDILRQIFKILINSTGDGESECQKKL